MKDVTTTRFSLFAAGINKPSSQRPYKQGTLKDVYCWMNSMKMMQLTDEVLNEHYAHLSSKPFFQRIKDSMMATPVVALCLKGVDAIAAVRALAGPTNGRNAAPGTIRGTYCMSFQENIVHTSDSPETAAVELKRFFNDNEIFEWEQATFAYHYASDEF